MFFLLCIFRLYIGFIIIMLFTYFFVGDDRGKSLAMDQTTPSFMHHVNLNVILGIYHDIYVLLI